MLPSEQADGDGTGVSAPRSEQAELERLRAENDALKEELDRERTPKRGRLRAVAVGVLVALAAITFTAAEVGIWARRSVLNSEVFSSRVVPLASDPAVQAAVSAKLTDEIMTLVDPQSLFQEALPDRAQLLAPVLTNAVRTFVADQVQNFMASDTFRQIWAGVVTRGHEAVIKVLNRESEFVSTSGDKIVISLVPVINEVLARIGEVSPSLFGKTIDIPTLTSTDLANAVPEEARQKLSQVLGRPVPAEFGTIEIQGAGDALSAAQTGVQLATVLVWALVIITVVLIPLALWLSHRRRRTLLQLTACLVVGTVLVRRVQAAAETTALDQVRVPTNRPAVQAVLDAFLDPLHDATTLVLWVLVLVALVAVVTGPYPWMVKARAIGLGLLRRGTASLGSVTGRAVDPAVADWVRTHRGTLQAAGVGVGVLVLLVVNLSWAGMLVVLALLGGYLAAVWWVTEEAAPTEPRPPSPATPVESPSAPAPS